MKKILFVILVLVLALSLTSCKKKKLTNKEYDSFAIDYASSTINEEGLYESRVEKIGDDYLLIDKGVEDRYYYYHLNGFNKYECFAKTDSGWKVTNVEHPLESEEEVLRTVGIWLFLNVKDLSGHDYKISEKYGKGYRQYREGGADYHYDEKYKIFVEISSYATARYVQNFEPSLNSFTEAPDFS